MGVNNRTILTFFWDLSINFHKNISYITQKIQYKSIWYGKTMGDIDTHWLPLNPPMPGYYKEIENSRARIWCAKICTASILLGSLKVYTGLTLTLFWCIKIHVHSIRKHSGNFYWFLWVKISLEPYTKFSLISTHQKFVRVQILKIHASIWTLQVLGNYLPDNS